MSVNGVNGTKLFGGIPIGVLIVLIGQIVATIIWAVRLDSKVATLETGQVTQDAVINHIDKTGSQALIRVEERQRSVIERIGIMQRQIDALVAIVNPHPPFRPPPQ